MTVRYHPELIQGSEEWHAARCGMLTASEFDRILTPKTLKIASNEKERLHLWELAAQRISQYVEPQYVSDSMLRGHDDEITARELYAQHFAPVEMCGFVTNDKWGFTLGCSPDGLVGEDGLIEVKSRAQRFQVQTIVENVGERTIQPEFVLQVQGQLLITERQWSDFISYSGGLPMAIIRVHPIQDVQDAIIEAAAKFEERINEVIAEYYCAEDTHKMVATERRVEMEMFA